MPTSSKKSQLSNTIAQKQQSNNNMIKTTKNVNQNKTINTKKSTNSIQTKARDTSGDTKVFQIIRKEDIEREKRLQSIKKENNDNKKVQENKNYNNYQKKQNTNKLNNYEKVTNNEKKSKKTPLVILLVILILCLILLIVSTIFGLLNHNSNKIIKGVCINNVEVGDLTRDEAIEKLNNKLNNEESNFIEITHGNYKHIIHLSDIQGKYNIEECVEIAYNLGRGSDVFTDNYKIIESMISKNNINTTFTYNEELLEKIVNEISIDLPDVATDSSYIIENNKLYIKNSKNGVQIQTSEFKKKIVESFSNGQKSFEIPVEQVERKEIDIEKIHNEIYKEAKNAYYTTNPRKVYKEENGLDFAISMDEAKEMLSKEQDEYIIELKVTKPKVTVANLDSGAFPDQLSSFTTNYGTGDVNRNTNIAIAARSINSVVVMPGETFSYNDLIGECSTRTGYRESTIYLNGELSKGVGGGICQVSTTLYNAVLRANLEIVERRNHSLRVTYVPAGHDAMVSIGSQDFKFKNNRNYPIKVVAFVGTGSITCQIHGLKNDTEYDVKLASTTLENTDTKQKVQTYKILYLNGKEVSRTLLSTDTYKKH